MEERVWTGLRGETQTKAGLPATKQERNLRAYCLERALECDDMLPPDMIVARAQMFYEYITQGA